MFKVMVRASKVGKYTIKSTLLSGGDSTFNIALGLPSLARSYGYLNTAGSNNKLPTTVVAGA